MEQERTPILNLRTSGTTAPSTSLIDFGEIAVSMNVESPRLWTKQLDDSLAEYRDKKYIDEHDITAISGDSYINGSVSAQTLSLSANVITTIEAFSALTENGSLADAKLLKDIIEEDEEITAAALNDLDNRLIEMSGVTKSLNESVSSLKNTVDENTSNIEDLQDDVEANTNSITALTTNVTKLQTAVSGNTKEINSVKTTVSAHTNNISALQTTTSSLTDDVNDLKTTTSGLTDDVNDLKNTISGLTYYNKIDVNNTIISASKGDTIAFSGTAVSYDSTNKTIVISGGEIIASGDSYVEASVVDNTITLSANVITTIEAFSALTENGSLVDAKLVKDIIEEDEEITAAALNDLDNRLIEISGLTKTTEETVSNLSNTVGSNTSDIEDLQDDVNDNTNSITALTTNVNTLQNTVTGLSTTVTTLQNTVTGHTANITSLQTAVSGNTNSINGIKTTVSAQTNDITSLKNTTSGLTNSVNGLGTTVSGLTYYNKIKVNNDTVSASKADTISFSGTAVSYDSASKTVVISGGEITASGDTYVSATASNGKVSVSADVITTEEAFSALTETGKLVDAKVVRDIIVDDEMVFAAMGNDLNDKIRRAQPKTIANPTITAVNISVTDDMTSNITYRYGTISSLTVSSIAITGYSVKLIFKTGSTAPTISMPESYMHIGNVTTTDTMSWYLMTICDGIVKLEKVTYDEV